MASHHLHNNDNIIYSIDLDEDDKQNKDYLSTTSKSDQYKTIPPQAQSPTSHTLDTFCPTQVIKINPNPHPEHEHLNQNTQNTPNSLLKNNLTFNLQNDPQTQGQTQIQNFEEDSSAKVKKSRRKRLQSPQKRRKHLEQQIIDYENAAQQILENQSLTEKTSQSSNNQSEPIENDNLNEKWKFQTIDKNQILSYQSKSNNYFEIQDSERNFDIKKQQKPKEQTRFSKHKKLKNIDESRDFSQRQQVKQISSCQVLIDDLSDESEDYNDSSEEQVYENEQASEEEKQIMYPIKKNQKAEPQLKIVKQLPKQILIETTLQSLIMNPVPKNMKMVCKFYVETKFFGMSKQYNLVIKQTGQTILSAKKQHFSFTGSKFIISLNKEFVSKRKDNQFWAGRLESNFSGTSYELAQRRFDSQTSQKKNSFNQDDEDSDNYSESLGAVINFENNLWGFSGIRKMEIMKLNQQKLTSKDVIKSTTLWDILERNELSKVTRIQTTKPEYNKATKRYSLDFEKKAKIPSAKNTILHWKVPEETANQSIKPQNRKLKNSFWNLEENTVDQSTESQYAPKKGIETELRGQKNKNQGKENKLQCLLVGKQSEKEYLVEVGHPLSLFEAFGACLANEDTKYMVN